MTILNHATELSFARCRMKVAVFALAIAATLVPGFAGAVSIYHRVYGFCVEWEGSFEGCNAWASFSPDYACFPDLFPTAAGADKPVIELTAKGGVILVSGRRSFKYAMLTPEGKKALASLGKGSSRTAVNQALEKAFDTSIKVIPPAQIAALARRYKARVVKLEQK